MSRKRRAPPAPTISSADEAERVIRDWIEPRKLTLVVHSDDDLCALTRRIWEDAYAAGRADARSDAAVEAAEAEWFHS